MSIQSPTGILDVTNATLRAGKLESTGDITCSSNLVVSGGFDLSAINSNADTVVDFTATRQLRKYPREILTSDSQNGYTITASENTNTSKHRAFNEDTYGTNERWVSQWVSGTGGRYDRTTGFYVARRTTIASRQAAARPRVSGSRFKYLRRSFYTLSKLSRTAPPIAWTILSRAVKRPGL